MERKPQAIKGAKGDQAKAARIKDALKANIARRKAQAQGRTTGHQPDGAGNKGQD
ncbi:MAG: hypothetical protein MUE98_06380 [Rhodobacteraceae bacterium]|jgi:hypothetical protein|nr:hypothetical protein [Paracoccaceae bacterium]